MTQPNRFARDVEATSALAAVAPHTPSPADQSAAPLFEPYGSDDKFAAARGPEASSPDLAPVPGAFEAPDPAWTTESLSYGAQVLHAYACACDWGGDVEGHHGDDFERNAATYRAAILGDAIERGEVVPIEDVPSRYPVEAKVSAGAWGSLAAGVGLALANLLLARLDLVPSLLGGESPWVGALVLVLGAVLPAVIGALRAYGAPHTPRARWLATPSE